MFKEELLSVRVEAHGATASSPVVGDPAPDWAAQNPEKFLTYLYVCPHPCDALEAILNND